MTPLLRKAHKWVGLIVGIQFLIWLATGLTMSLFDHHAVTGHATRAPVPPAPTWPAAHVLTPAQVLAASVKQIGTLEAYWAGRIPAYRAKSDEETWLIDARTGKQMAVDAALAATVAQADYAGSGRALTPSFLAEPNLETRMHSGPVWRVDFDDAAQTTVYVSAEDARVLERRNSTWRWFDIAWMLHIMDYSGRQDFNNSLLFMAAVGGLWMALSGIWLLCVSVRLHEFIPARWLPSKHITVVDEASKRIGIVKAHAGDDVFRALGRAGIHLPSNCGGGQSCGLCEVRACHGAPDPSAADKAHIAVPRLKRGHRLACGLRVEEDMEVAVSHGAALMVARSAVVERVTAVTPFLREIVLRPDQRAGSDFKPGSYIQLQIPRYRFGAASLVRPAHHSSDWGELALPATLRSRQPLRRAYSLAMPTSQADGCLTLLVRFSPGRTDSRHPPGKGSSYVYSLKPGDHVSFNGPFGEFGLRHGHREKVFIGGGAGMAPLRAMVHALLEGGASEPIWFWYGARTARDVPYADEFAELASRYPNFHWHVVLSDEAQPDGGPNVPVHLAVHADLLQRQKMVGDMEFYVCGPPAMLKATREMLQEMGAERVSFDDFKI